MIRAISNIYKAERCQSGLMSMLGKYVYLTVPRVRISSFPLYKYLCKQKKHPRDDLCL